MTGKTGKISRLLGRAGSARTLMAAAATPAKNSAIREMARLLAENAGRIEKANRADMEAASAAGVSGQMLKRLSFDRSRIDSRIRSLDKIAALPDPVGRIFDPRNLENGLQAARMRVPLGVILMICEARPHVTVNAGALALKAGNALICKGGSEAAGCNQLLGQLWSRALENNGLPGGAVQAPTLDHAEVEDLLGRTGEIDLVIPRGGKNLVRAVRDKSRIPVISHYEGNCHLYLDADADPEKALAIAIDSKLLMPSVCNAAEKILVHRALLEWLPGLLGELADRGVEIRGCPETRRVFPRAKAASEEDWDTEFLDLVYGVRVVDSLEEATGHIAARGSGHTESIVTGNYSNARAFLRLVDSAVVLVNASTMFCDGETLGMGAEIGISTGKLHARGPMGLEELTTYKHVITGDGQVMGTGREGEKTGVAE